MADKKSDLAAYLFHQGTNFECYRYLGAHPCQVDGADGAVFRVWAPNAVAVAVVGDFNGWDNDTAPMTKISNSGLFECAVRDVKTFDAYKYLITTESGSRIFKTDPYGFHFETRPGTAAKYYDLAGYAWGDDTWTQRRDASHYNKPMNIYELHLGSWQRNGDGSFLDYRTIAGRLAAYVNEMGYTHVELMPVAEYPFDGSWGYQVTGYYAPTSRYGTPHDFMSFVDTLHQHGIGVIMDWVPAHFPKDDFALREFDGGFCYEDQNPTRREQEEWGTCIFDYGRPEVQSFLVSNALYWLDCYHIDGIRVDAVASMLYLDYGRKNGQWQKNSFGGNENLEAVAFLRKLNTEIFARFPNALSIAEESTAWPLVTKPIYDGGLGFNYKWNMGWMNDVLAYNALNPFYRKDNHNKMTFSMTYAFSENYVLPLSHDEVVHGKCSLIEKMPGSYEEKFSGLKALLGFMYAHPGKKLLFMGQEFAQFIEWNYEQQLDWFLLEYDSHRKFQNFTKDLNRFYRENPALWEVEDSWNGFKWIVPDDRTQNILSFIRTPKNGPSLIAIFNFSPVERVNYKIGVPNKGTYHCLFSSNAEPYGGTEKAARPDVTAKLSQMHGFRQSIELTLPGLSALFYTVPPIK